MKIINNKFEKREECYTYVKENIIITCPVCNGIGKIYYNGCKIPCKKCGTSGKIIEKQVIPQKVRIRKIITTWKRIATIKYKVDSIGDHIFYIKNREESSLFKTFEECEQKCKEINQGNNNTNWKKI